MRKAVERSELEETRQTVTHGVRCGHIQEKCPAAQMLVLVTSGQRPDRFERWMNSERNVQLLRLGKNYIVVGMRVRFARHHELAHPCALASGLDRAPRRESAEPLATLESRRTPPDFDVLDTLLVAAQTERLWLVFLLDVVFP